MPSFIIREKINMKNLRYLVNSRLLEEWDKKEYNRFQENEKKLKKGIEIPMHEQKNYYILSKLKEYERNILGADDFIDIEYYLDEGEYGRYKIRIIKTDIGFGATNMFGEIRNLLFSDNYIDLDIRCAHPCIIYNLCIMYNIECIKLKNYIVNRDAILQEIVKQNPKGKYKGKLSSNGMENGVAKEFITGIFYNGNIDNLMKDYNLFVLPDSIKELHEELKNIMFQIINLPEYKHISDFAKQRMQEKNKTYNEAGSIFAIIIQDIERQIYDMLSKLIKKAVLN